MKEYYFNFEGMQSVADTLGTVTSESIGPRWLDETEMRVWRAFLEANGRLTQRINDGLKAAGDMTLDDYEVLVHLSESDAHRLRMSELSERLLHSQSRLTQRIDRLAGRGYVVREKCPEDRQGTFAVLTPAGLEALQATAPHHLGDVRAALIDLIEPHEQAVLADVLERVAQSARLSDA